MTTARARVSLPRVQEAEGFHQALLQAPVSPASPQPREGWPRLASQAEWLCDLFKVTRPRRGRPNSLFSDCKCGAPLVKNLIFKTSFL